MALEEWWRRSALRTSLGAVGFMLYTVVTVNLVLLLRPLTLILQWGRPRGVSTRRVGRRLLKRRPSRRRRGEHSLHHPLLNDAHRSHRRQLSVPGCEDAGVSGTERHRSLGDAQQDASHTVSEKAGVTGLLRSISWRSATGSTAATARSTPPSAPPLFLTRLPLELRQEIYRLALTGRVKQFVRLDGDDGGPAEIVLNHVDYYIRDLPHTFTYRPIRATQHHPGKLLSLPLTCRQIYIESIAILYQATHFKISRLFTLTDLSIAFLPQRFAAIRSLEIGYEFRCGLPLTRAVAIGEDADWTTCWTLIAQRMPGLRKLRLDFFSFDVFSLIDQDEDTLIVPAAQPHLWRWLLVMLQVSNLRRCQVKLYHVRRFTEVLTPRRTSTLSWFAMVVLDALQLLVAASLTGRGLPMRPPLRLQGNDKVEALWATCRDMVRLASEHNQKGVVKQK